MTFVKAESEPDWRPNPEHVNFAQELLETTFVARVTAAQRRSRNAGMFLDDADCAARKKQLAQELLENSLSLSCGPPAVQQHIELMLLGVLVGSL